MRCPPHSLGDCSPVNLVASGRPTCSVAAGSTGRGADAARCPRPRAASCSWRLPAALSGRRFSSRWSDDRLARGARRNPPWVAAYAPARARCQRVKRCFISCPRAPSSKRGRMSIHTRSGGRPITGTSTKTRDRCGEDQLRVSSVEHPGVGSKPLVHTTLTPGSTGVGTRVPGTSGFRKPGSRGSSTLLTNTWEPRGIVGVAGSASAGSEPINPLQWPERERRRYTVRRESAGPCRAPWSRNVRKRVLTLAVVPHRVAASRGGPVDCAPAAEGLGPCTLDLDESWRRCAGWYRVRVTAMGLCSCRQLSWSGRWCIRRRR